MSPLLLICSLLTACDPLPVVPVPVAPSEPEAVTPPEPTQAPKDTAPPTETNRAPVILGIEVEPPAPRTDDDITIRVEAEDPDRDHVRLEYTWLVNDREMRGQRQATLPHTFFSKGDLVRARIVAKDREAETEGSTSVIIVRNTPPEITNKAGSLRQVDGFRILAHDIDRDVLTYHLEGAPDGMSIDPSTGVLGYKGSESAKAGNYQVNVVVEDPDGGVAKWAFGITVSAGSAADRRDAAEAEAAAAPRNRRGRAVLPREEASETEE